MPHPQNAAIAWRQLIYSIHCVRDRNLHLLPYRSGSVKSLTPCMLQYHTSLHDADIIKADAQALPTLPATIETPSPTPQPAPTPSSNSSELSTGEIVGIVIAVVLGIPSLVGGIYKFSRWWKERSQVKSPQPASRRRSGRRMYAPTGSYDYDEYVSVR